MIIAIRDDDTSFFTQPSDLESAYDFVKTGPISLSVVPSTVPVHGDDVYPYGENIPFGYYPIEQNKGLVSYLREGIKANRYVIALHGYSHEYKKIECNWLPEMAWKDEGRICSELFDGKKRLEQLFHVPVSVFVAPNNCIDSKGIHAVEKLRMNYSGIIYHGDRDINMKYIDNFIKRWSFRLAKGVQYPGCLNYGKHKEISAYTLDNFMRLKKEYEICKAKNTPFIVYSHYWQINRKPEVKNLLMAIYEYAVLDGAKLVSLSECFTR